MSERAYADYPDFFSPLFEVIRRYKIMNPEKMRDTYGKLIYLLQVNACPAACHGPATDLRLTCHRTQPSQDANTPEMIEELGLSLVAPIRTVHAKLAECDALALLKDDQIAVATQVCVLPTCRSARPSDSCYANTC